MRLQHMYVATILLLLGASSSIARAEWIQWPSSAGGNDHWYQAVATPGGITSSDAVDAALVAGGWLVTVTSAQESTFVFERVDSVEYWFTTPGNAAGPWLGAYQPPGSAEPDGGWTWVTGEPWVCTNWAPGEPNNQGGNQDSAMLWGPEGVWSDHME